MGINKQDNLLNDYISRYFTKGEAEEFSSEFLVHLDLDRSDSQLKPAAGQISIDSFNSYYLNTRLDHLITFAEKKFTGNKLLSFLLYLGEFAITSGEMDSALNIYNKIFDQSSKDSRLADIQANAALSIGEVFSRQAKWRDSLKFIRKASGLFKTNRNSKGLARCENLLGTIYGDMGKISLAKEHFENSFNILRNGKDLALLGTVEINLGIINLIQEDYKTALLYLKRALSNFKQAGDYKRIAEIYYNTGMAHLKMGDYKCALAEFDSALNTAQDLSYLPLMVLSYLSKSQVYLKQNDNNLANAFADKSMEIAYKLNDRLTVADAYRIKGVIQRNLNNYTAAENYFLTSLRLNKEISNQYNYAETSYELGLLYKETGKSKQSSNYFNTAITYYKKIKAFNELKKMELIMN
jgi:tetratricopeptide (TPR) repeat protein